MKRIIAVLSVLSIAALLFATLEFWLPRTSSGYESSDFDQKHDSPVPKQTPIQDQIQPPQADLSTDSSLIHVREHSDHDDTIEDTVVAVSPPDLSLDTPLDTPATEIPSADADKNSSDKKTVSTVSPQVEAHNKGTDALQQPEQYEAYARVMSQAGAYAIRYNPSMGEMMLLKDQPRNNMNRYSDSYLNDLTAGIGREDHFLHGAGAEYEFVVARRFDPRNSILTVVIVKGNYETKQRTFQRIIYREIEPGRLHIRIIDAAGVDVEEPYSLIINHSFADYIQQRIDKPLMV